MQQKHKPIVPIERWLRDRFYNGPEATALAPFWYSKIVQFFRGKKRNLIFTGSLRSGKTYALCIIIKRYLYEMSRWESFPELFNLSATTLPKLVFLSLSADKAESTGLDRLIRMVDTTPYFSGAYARARITSELRFPWAVVYSGSNVNSLVGDDVCVAVLDEASIRGVAKAQVLQETHDLFMEMKTRSQTTYSIGGVWGGFTGIAATAGRSTSFVDLEVQKAKRNPDGDSFLVEAAMYDVDPTKFSKERFQVFTGDGIVPPFIVDMPNEDIIQTLTSQGQTVQSFIIDSSFMANPPVSLKKLYIDDLAYSLQNISGVTQQGGSLFITNHKWIDRLWSKKVRYPTRLMLENQVVDLGLYDTTLPEDLIDEDMVNESYDGQPVYMAFDISRVNDPSAFSAIYYDEETKKIKSLLLCSIYLDRLKSGNEIDQVKLFGLVTCLWRMGVNIRMVTADGYASDYVIQRAKKLLGNDRARRMSVDKEVMPHLTMLGFMKLGMYELYYMKRLEYELENLVYDKVEGKVDHPPNTDPVHPIYFKDLSDTLASASFSLSIGESLDYENIMVLSAVEKHRIEREQNEEIEDFYGDVEGYTDDGFYEDAAVGLREEDTRVFNEEKAKEDYMRRLESGLFF